MRLSGKVNKNQNERFPQSKGEVGLGMNRKEGMD